MQTKYCQNIYNTFALMTGFRIKYIFTFCFFACICNLYAQPELKPKYVLKGFVFGADSSTTIPLANIQNINSKNRYISNRFGAFGVNVSENDTLVFSVIGYKPLYLAVKFYVLNNIEAPVKIYLKSTTYKLRELEVNFSKRRQDSMARQAAIIMKTSPLLNDYTHIESWLTANVGGDITSLFAGSVKKAQEYEKLLRLIELYRIQQRIDEKLNDDLIMRATGLEKEDVMAFKKYCNFPNYFVLNSTDYDLVLAIKNYFEEYRQTNSGKLR